MSNELADLIAEKKEWERGNKHMIRFSDSRMTKSEISRTTWPSSRLNEMNSWITSSLSQTVEEEEEQGRYSGDLQPKTLALLLSITLPNIEF